jgi:predicted patatin/cPLA2 family phospholipase
MKKTGLVLEGGGMRGSYSGGILEFFMEKDLYFPYVIGVSAGACVASTYIAKQKGRNKVVFIDYVKHPRYISLRNLFSEKSIFGMNLIFDEIPNKLYPLDYETLRKSKQKFIICATNGLNGRPEYFDKDSCDDIAMVIRASSSLPFVSQPVNYKGMILLDGGISDPIPIKKSIQDGNCKNIIILTRHKGYRKKPFKLKWLASKLSNYNEQLLNALFNRYRVYNETLDYIDDLEAKNKVFVFRQKEPVKVKRMEKNTKKLIALYKQGYKDAKERYDELMDWLYHC